jgi:hypothetical protein
MHSGVPITILFIKYHNPTRDVTLDTRTLSLCRHPFAGFGAGKHGQDVINNANSQAKLAVEHINDS